MNALALYSAQAAETLVAALVSAVWQGAALALAAALTLRLLPRLSAATRSAIWLAVFALATALHLAPMIFTQGAASPAHATAVRLDPRWSLAAAALWFFFSLLRFVQLALSVVRLRGLIARSTPVEPTAAAARRLAAKRGRPAVLSLSHEVERPCVAGFFRPRILMPPELMETLSEEELELVLEHEMEHLRRRDAWSNLAQKLALTLFPLNPALLWMERRLCAERELACDDRVLGKANGAKAYATCLTRLAEFSLTRRSLALALGAWERRSELARRVERILARPARAMSSGAARAATAGVVGLAALGAVELSRTPQLVSFAPKAETQLEAKISAPQTAVFTSAAASFHALPAKVKVQKAIQPKAQPEPPAAVAQQPELAAAAEQEAALAPVRVEPVMLVLTGADDRNPSAQADLGAANRREPPAQVFDAVERLPRARYAAVAVPGGWLIVKI